MNKLAAVRKGESHEGRGASLQVVVDNSSGLPSSLWPEWVACGITGGLLVIYGVLFFSGIAAYWFSPDWTTDDAYQQLFPLLEAVYPERFEGDVNFRMMRGYLTPIHYWLSYGITLLTESPVMTGHWVMLVQVAGTLGFMYLVTWAACRPATSSRYGFIAASAPALFAVMWMLHTRHVMQRLTAGLPRGWSAPVLLAFLYCAVAKRHLGVLVSLLVGCLLHPPSTFIAALTYGVYLVLGVLGKETRSEYLPKLRGYVVLSPLYLVVTYLSIRMPAEFGGMANLETAASMPEFARPGGRFPFVPLLPYWKELHLFGFQAFLNKWFTPHFVLRLGIPLLSAALVFTLAFSGWLKRKEYIPKVVLVYGACCLLVHELSRCFAFYLYVPNRHLQFPMAIFFVIAVTVGLWRLLTGIPAQGSSRERFSSWYGTAGLLVLMCVVLSGSGLGLTGRANFNTHVYQKGKFAAWLKKYSPEDALIAGHPTLVDPVPLFAERRVFISTELAHPFYRGYYNLIKDRVELSLRAHYAKSLEELYDMVAPQGIDYFVFHRALFYPEALASASYFRPYDQVVYEVTRVPNIMQFAYRELPAEVDLAIAPYMPFKDEVAAVVDIHRLGRALGRE